MFLEMEPITLEKLLGEGNYCRIFDKMEVEGLDIIIRDHDFTFSMSLEKGKDLQRQTIDELTKLVNLTLFETNPCPEKIIRNGYFSKPDTYNFIVRKTGDKNIVGFAQVLSLEKTNAAYYLIAAILPKVRSMGFYSLSTCLSIIYALYKEHDYVVGRTMSPLIIEILNKYGFYYPKLDEQTNMVLISKAKEIMNEYMDRKVKINDKLILDGNEMATSGYIPSIQISSDPNINEFMKKYVSGINRLILIKPIDEKKDQKEIGRQLSRIHRRFI